jgi:hypothetical protein
MDYEFSWGAFMIGVIITIIGVLVLRFYQPLADNLSSGAVSYDRFKLAGLIGTIVGIIVMLNLHTFLIRTVFITLF